MAIPSQTRRDGESMEAFLNRLHQKYNGNPATMAQMLEIAVRRNPQKTALVDGQGNRLSYSEMGHAVSRIAGGLRSAGIMAGERVAIMMRSHAHYVLAYYSVITRGMVAVPINVRLAARELAYIFDNAGVKLVIADQEFSTVLKEVLGLLGREIPCYWTGPATVEFGQPWDVLAQGEETEIADIHEDSLAAIYYTSGTTGQPKGAMITHLNMTAVGQQNVEAWYFDSPDVVELEISPLFHVSFQEFGPTIHWVGGTLVVDNFSPARSLDLIDQEGVNSFFAVPSMLLLMMEAQKQQQRDLSRVRLVKYGGAPMPAEVMARVRQTFPAAQLVQGFGQTESTGMIAVTWPEEVYDFPLSTGRAISGCNIRILDAEENPLQHGSVGEIVAQGPQIMAGYWKNPSASEETLRGGFLHTGDLGYLDEGQRLYVVDRKKDLIIRGGQNIYSAEVEEVIYGHPAVTEVAVVGQPDPIYGEVVVAFVRVHPGDLVTAEELNRYLEGRIAIYKRPVAYYIVDDFPRTASGKVRKVELRQRLAESGKSN